MFNLNILKKKLSNSYKSITNWFNVTGIVLLQSIITYPDLITYLDTKGLFYIIIIGNIIIRMFKTNTAIEDK